MAKKIKRKFSSATILNKYDDVEIEIDGKTFSVAKRLPMLMLTRLEAGAEEGKIDMMVKLMAELFGVQVKDIEDLDLDIRVFRHIFEYVMQVLTEQIQAGAKNPTEAETSSQK